MAKTDRKTIPKKLQCKKCNNVQEIRRIIGRNRETGHIKNIYCFKCMRKTAHIELSQWA